MHFKLDEMRADILKDAVDQLSAVELRGFDGKVVVYFTFDTSLVGVLEI